MEPQQGTVLRPPEGSELCVRGCGEAEISRGAEHWSRRGRLRSEIARGHGIVCGRCRYTVENVPTSAFEHGASTTFCTPQHARPVRTPSQGILQYQESVSTSDSQRQPGTCSRVAEPGKKVYTEAVGLPEPIESSAVIGRSKLLSA